MTFIKGRIRSLLPDTSFFRAPAPGTNIESNEADETLCKGMLRKLGFDRNQFGFPLEEYSEG